MGQAVEVLSILQKTYPNAKHYLIYKNPLELLVASILSPQVRDEVVNAATPVLFKDFKTAKDYAHTTQEKLLSYINKITFAENKAKHIIAACKLLEERHEGVIPQTQAELTELPGVGKKTAFSIMQNAFNKVEGIVVDTHVLRVSFRLGWTSHQKNADIVERELETIIPKTEWKTLPWLLKAHGRAICTPNPKCSTCPLNTLCPKRGVA